MKDSGNLQLAYYGDDFTGSTDALEQLTLAGVKTLLFVKPPDKSRLSLHPDLQAIGVAGKSRSMAPTNMRRTLRQAFNGLRSLEPRHVHYKVCSTFDSSPNIGSIGCALDVAANMLDQPFIPVLAAAPSLGRFCTFGNMFARYGIGSAGTIHRLDRHPSVSKHPVTPMTESDIRLHLSAQTQRKIGLIDVITLAKPIQQCRARLRELIDQRIEFIIFDALTAAHVKRIGQLLDPLGEAGNPLFSVGSSGIEQALTSAWKASSNPSLIPKKRTHQPLEKPVLIGSGSCSPVNMEQIDHALSIGFHEVALNAEALISPKEASQEIQRATWLANEHLNKGNHVIIHTTKTGASRTVTDRLKNLTASTLGTALGKVMRQVAINSDIKRLCIAGGDTSSYAAKALNIEALEMIARLTPGAPICRVHSKSKDMHGREIIFKGGQVGGRNYFELVTKG